MEFLAPTRCFYITYETFYMNQNEVVRFFTSCTCANSKLGFPTETHFLADRIRNNGIRILRW
jgi:hypothetical protein